MSGGQTFIIGNRPGRDSTFFASGSVGGKDVGDGVGVFGGDLLVSGGVYHLNPLDKIAPNSGYGDIIRVGNSPVTAGKIYYYSSTGWALADADDAAKGAYNLLAIALGTNSSQGMLVKGFANTTVDNQGSNDEGKPIYVSRIAGNITGSAPVNPGQFVRLVGNIVDDNGIIYFSPSNNWVEL